MRTLALLLLIVAACGGGSGGGTAAIQELEPNDSAASALLLAALDRGQLATAVGQTSGGGAAPCHDFDYWEVQATDDGLLRIRLASTDGYSAALSFSFSVNGGGGASFIQAYESDAEYVDAVSAGDVVSIVVDSHWSTCALSPYRLVVGLE